MDMSIAAEGSLWSRLASRSGFTSVSHIFVMEWAAVLRDIVIGLLIAGAVGAWVPGLVLAAPLPDRPSARRQDLGAADRPAGRDPELRLLDRQRPARRGAVERRDQLRRGRQLHLRRPDHPADPGDLPEVLRHADGGFPVRHVLRCQCRRRIRHRDRFSAHRAVPGGPRHAKVENAELAWNYTTFLNIAFLILAAVLVVRFLRTGGMPMLRMMGGSPDSAEHDHEGQA